MLTHADPPKDTPDRPAPPPTGTGIVVDQVTKHYGARTALDDVSLEVPQGSVLALLGPNGAGKTTLVRVLTTLIRPDRGRAMVGGYDVVAEADMVRRSIGLVGQHAAVDEYLTGRENLTLVARLLRMGSAEARRQTAAAIESFGLAEVADAPAATYSGGLRRRLDIAVTLLAQPAVMFLDEPTTGLDPASRRDVWRLVERLAAAGTTILLTTQYLEEADRLADTVAVIDHGRLIATGTPDALKARLGGDTVSIRLADPATPHDAAGALRAGLAIDAVEHEDGTVEVRADDGAALLPDALRLLDGRGLAVTAAEVQRPGLDDVFLALTGERRPPSENGDHAPQRRRSHGHGGNKTDTTTRSHR
jgi:ABC-2 type transport system ATP-binding protein